MNKFYTDSCGDIRRASDHVIIFKNYSGHGQTTSKQQAEYAEIFVRCVNAHEDLVNALQVEHDGATLSRAEFTEKWTDLLVDRNGADCKNMRIAALAKATGGAA